MGKFIESLESRQLFSTVPAFGTLEVDARTALADLKALKNTGHSNFIAIESELKGAGEIKSSASALRALASHATAAENALTRTITKSGVTLLADSKRLISAAAHEQKKPTSSALQKAVASADTKLRNDSSTHLIAINTAITNVADTDKTYAGQILSLNSSDSNLKTTFTNAGDASSAARTTLSNAATTVLTTDVDALIEALTGAPV